MKCNLGSHLLIFAEYHVKRPPKEIKKKKLFFGHLKLDSLQGLLVNKKGAGTFIGKVGKTCIFWSYGMGWATAI